MSSQSPVERYDAARNNNKFIFVVFYRGSWCPFCQAYLSTLQSISSQIAEAGGKVLIVTSEAESELPKMRAASGFTGEAIVDPENILAKELKRRGVIDVAISSKSGYPHGMVQPAVLIGSTSKLWYRWAIVPAMMNLGGAKDRPLLNEVWDNVQAQMQDKPVVHKDVGVHGLGFGLKKKIFGTVSN